MTNGMAKLYDRLNAKERVAALLQAFVRGDDLETQRLNATAPRRTARRWHHFDRVQAVWSIAATVRIEQLATLADLWHAQARLAWVLDDDEVADDPVPDDIACEIRLWRAFADGCCWKLLQQQTAWGIVCERLGIAPEFLDQFGDCIALPLTEARLSDNTPTADTLRERLAEFGASGELTTVETVAVGWLEMFSALNG